MHLLFTPRGWEDYRYWQSADPAKRTRIDELLRDAMRSPFRGIGKPEPVRDNWKGWWSRRISDEHRLVYRVTGAGTDQRLEVAQCRYHY